MPADDPRVGLRGEWGCIAGLEGRKSGAILAQPSYALRKIESRAESAAESPK